MKRANYLECFNEPLWDSEIIPVKGVRRLHLFTTPIGQRFQYFDSVKTFDDSNTVLAGTLPLPNEFTAKDIAIGMQTITQADIFEEDLATMKSGILTLIHGQNNIIIERPVKEILVTLGTSDPYKIGENKILPPDTIIEIKSNEAFRVEIDWDKEYLLMIPIRFSVVLLGLLWRVP